MSRITILPHPVLCPEGTEFEAKPGIWLCDALLKNHVAIEHACEKSCACATCHVIIRQGYESLEPPFEDEEDQLEHAWGLEPTSRLACQVMLSKEDLVIELPRYTVNLARERD